MSDDIQRYLAARLADPIDRRHFIKLGLTGVGIAAACGTSAVPPSGPTGPPFKVGLVVPTSGVYAELGQSLINGMQMYLDSVANQAGNRKIVIVQADEAVALADAVAATKRVVEEDHVDMVTGYISSPNAAGNRDYLDTNKIPTLISNGGSNIITRAGRSRYIYRSSHTSWQYCYPIGTYVAEKLGKKKIQLVYAKYGAGLETTANFKEGFTAAGGSIVGPDVTIPYPNTGDQTPYLQAIKTADEIDGVFCFMAGTDAISFLRKAAELGTFKKIGLVSAAGHFVEQDVLAALGDASPEGVINGLTWALTLPSKENQDFVTKYAAKFPGRQADVYAVYGYDAAHVIVDALGAVKGRTDDKDAFLNAIAGVRFKSPRGDFRFDPNTHNVIQSIYIRKTIKDPKLGWTNQSIYQYPDVTDPGK